MKPLKCASLILLIVFIFLVMENPKAQANPNAQAKAIQVKGVQVEKGILDLTHWDIHQEIVSLDGEWEFYWKKLLTYQDFTTHASGLKPHLYAAVPNTWNNYELNGRNLPGQGFATYRMQVRTSLPSGSILALRLYTFSSAYKLYINEQLIASNGRVAQSVEQEIGQYRPQTVFFKTPAKEFDLIVQVSNFSYARGGFWYTVSMGSPEEILELQDNLVGKETFLLGALLITGLFYFAIYILRRELKYTLYFALLCLSIAIGMDMVGQLFISRFFSAISFETIILLWYSSAEWIVLFLLLYVHELYPSKVSKIVVKLFAVVVVCLQLLYIFAPTVLYTGTGHITNYVEIIAIAATVVIVAIAIKNGHKSSWLNIISMFIVLTTYVHDVLYWTHVIRSPLGEVFYAGLFLFILLQMVIQAQRIKLFHQDKTAAELTFLQAQIKPHFLYNALNTFIAISHYDMDKARNLLTEFSHYLRRSFDFKDLSQFVPLKNELELARSYIEIEKARFEERIEVTFSVPEVLETRVPILVLQPLIENAVIHGILPKSEGGCIEVAITRDNKLLNFTVKDDGMGMSGEQITRHLKYGEGKGIGLANIDSRLRKIYGKGLEIKSSPGTGTEITWTIPMAGGENSGND